MKLPASRAPLPQMDQPRNSSSAERNKRSQRIQELHANAATHLPVEWRLPQNFPSFGIFRFFRPSNCRIKDQLIRVVRYQQVILDRDLAPIYGVETRALNQAVKRNRKRFPAEFVFELSPEEIMRMSQIVTSQPDPESSALRSQIVISKPGRGGRRYAPYAFTEHGALMAATVLNSPRAVKMSLFIIRAFVKMREDHAANAAILKRLAEIDRTLLAHDSALRDVYQKLRPLLLPPPEPPKKEIGFHTVK